MPHPAGAGGLPPAGLDGPPVLPCPGAGVAAVGARLLLDVERHLAATPAQRVRLVAPLSKRARSLRLDRKKRKLIPCNYSKMDGLEKSRNTTFA